MGEGQDPSPTYDCAMISERQIDAAIAALFERPDFPDEPAGLYGPAKYMINIGGKRIRPRLCLTAYGLFRPDITEGILGPAAALEVLHSFTLAHDDIMDRSPLRRGQPTIWKKWDESTGILSGDVMCIDSYRLLAKAPSAILPKALLLFTKTATQVCEGQQHDMDFESMEAVSMEDYMKMIGLKTGVLIACAAKMGALVAGASDEVCESLYKYGYYLGLAFQVADDWLDAYGDESVFGKPIGGDIVNNKKCWLTTCAQEHGSVADILEMPVGTTEEKAAKIAAMKKIYGALGVDRKAEAEIDRLTQVALSYAAGVCSKMQYECLRRFALQLVGRKK